MVEISGEIGQTKRLQSWRQITGFRARARQFHKRRSYPPTWRSVMPARAMRNCRGRIGPAQRQRQRCAPGHAHDHADAGRQARPKPACAKPCGKRHCQHRRQSEDQHAEKHPRYFKAGECEVVVCVAAQTYARNALPVRSRHRPTSKQHAPIARPRAW